MKKYWLYILMAVCLTACKGIKTVNSDMEEEQLGCENEIAKAIIWIDWKRGEDISDFHLVRTAKVHVNVYSDGTFRNDLSFLTQEVEGRRIVYRGAASGAEPSSDP